MKTYEWKSVSDRYYYYDTYNGKIVGLASKIALQEIFFGIVYVGKYTFTVNDEYHLGQYISLEHAKKAIEHYWEVESKTLLEK
jgi:hypothetical protein